MLRIVAIPLWFVSVWFAYGLVSYFLGVPADGGAVIGALAAAFVAIDPTGAFWGGRSRATAETGTPDALNLTSPTR